MVRFERFSQDGDLIQYRYYPENKAEFGVIVIDLKNGTFQISQLAPQDFVRKIPVQELNALRDSVNEMRLSEGDPPLTEEEWPSASEPSTIAFYASHVVHKLSDAFKSGAWPESGTLMWY